MKNQNSSSHVAPISIEMVKDKRVLVLFLLGSCVLLITTCLPNQYHREAQPLYYRYVQGVISVHDQEDRVDNGKGIVQPRIPVDLPPRLQYLFRQPFNVNKAETEELDLLPGIGPSLAGKIISYRQEHGYFTSVDELTRVPGIGPKTLSRLNATCPVTVQ